MGSFARMFQIPMLFRAQQSSNTPLFGENGFGTTSGSADIESCLAKACALPRPEPDGTLRPMSSAAFVRVASFLQVLDNQHERTHPYQWCLRPRIYTLLRAVGGLSYMEDFVVNNINDISIPFNHQTLPGFLKDDTLRTRFLNCQSSVVTDARRLEDSSEKHIYFEGSAEEHIVSQRPLGHGGFGYVDVVISRLSAKLYARKRVARGRDSADNRRAQRYLVDEISVMKTVRHRHLTTIIQSYSDSRYIGFLMEPIADCDLNHFLAKKPFPEEKISALRHFFGCLASGVDYLHQKQIRHRDLKLQNVLVKNSRLFIADFGTAVPWTASSRGTTQSRNVPVTQRYMAPEVDDKQSRNVASDMWSLGLIFLEILTVVKGRTIPKWIDHLRKRANALKVEPWPCRNLAAVHEWMAMLATAQRDQDVDDETLAWRDNEPLTWIKALLEYNQDARLNSRALVMTIADSIYCRSYACPDCVEEFLDPHNRYNEQQGMSQGSKNEIDAEVTALFSVVAQPTEQQDDQKAALVTRWLGETQDCCTAADYEDQTMLPIPGAFTNWLGEEAYEVETFHTSMEPELPLALVSTQATEIDGTENSPAASGVLHGGGFFVVHDESSSEDENESEGHGLRVQPNGLFPITYDASSEEEDDYSMLDQILEECEEFRTPEAPLACSGTEMLDMQRRESDALAVHFPRGSTSCHHVEESNPPQTVEPRRPGATLPSSAPFGKLVQVETDTNNCHRDQSKVSHDSKAAVGESDQTGIADDASVEAHSASEEVTKGPTKSTAEQKRPIVLSLCLDPSLRSATHHTSSTLQQPNVLTDVKRTLHYAPDILAEDVGNLNLSPTMAPPSGLKQPISVPTKLSAANVGRFNKKLKHKRRTERRSFADDNFTPAKFINAAWLAAETADSLATSAMSDTTRRNFRGWNVKWNDKAYSHLEQYCKAGKVEIVRHLLSQGCECGTRARPRPRPLINAIEGGSVRHNKCVRALIKQGTNVNAKYRGKTPIHRVLEQPYFYGYQKLLAMMLAAGAEMNSQDSTGEYPLTKLFKGAAGDVPLEDYQKDCLALIFHPSVQAAVDFNVRQPFTLDTPLHQAVRRRTAQAVALLIHKGADVNAKNASGTTPLLTAANQWRGKLSDQQERMLYYLLDARALDVDAKGGPRGRTALHHAAAGGCAVALEMLLESGASTKITDKDGKDVLAILAAGKDGEDYQDMRDMLDGFSNPEREEGGEMNLAEANVVRKDK